MMFSISQRYVGKLLVTVFLKLLYLEYANTSSCLGPPLKSVFSFLFCYLNCLPFIFSILMALALLYSISLPI